SGPRKAERGGLSRRQFCNFRSRNDLEHKTLRCRDLACLRRSQDFAFFADLDQRGWGCWWGCAGGREGKEAPAGTRVFGRERSSCRGRATGCRRQRGVSVARKA